MFEREGDLPALSSLFSLLPTSSPMRSTGPPPRWTS